ASALAALPRRPLSVLAAGARRGNDVLCAWRRVDVACRAGAPAPLDVRDLPRGLHRRLPHSLRPRRERRAAPLRGAPAGSAAPLAPAVAATAGLPHCARARCIVERDPDRRAIPERARRPGVAAGLLDA